LIFALFNKLTFTDFEFKDLYFILNPSNWEMLYQGFRKLYTDFKIGQNTDNNTSLLAIQFEAPKELDVNKFVTYNSNTKKSIAYPTWCLRGIYT
jgi:hypothetical protein